MEDYLSPPERPLYAPLLSGPVQIGIALLVIALGLYHLWLTTGVLRGRRAMIPPSLQVILLFSGPQIVLLSTLAFLPPEIPGLCIIGIDAGNGLRHWLEYLSLVASISLGIFVINLAICLTAHFRHRSGTGEPA